METENKTFICHKCGGTVIITENQNLASCPSCNSLIPLPYFMTTSDPKINSETFNNMLNRVNKASEYNIEGQFHRAFNLYDKLIKNYYNLQIEDYYPYFGKLLSQFGVIYNLNDKLQYELVCLNILDEPVTVNENYLKMMELADANTKEIIHHIANEIDQYQKHIQKEIIDISSSDVTLLVDTSDSNPKALEDLELAKTIQHKFSEKQVKITVTEDLFKNGLSYEFSKEIYAINNLSSHLVVISSNFEHLNNNLFRHVWMNYYSSSELKSTINERMFIICDEQENIDSLPINTLRFYKTSDLEKLCIDLNKSAKFIRKDNEKILNSAPQHEELFELLNNQEFEKVKEILYEKIDTVPMDYVEWWLLYLTKHNIANEVELKNKVINPIESYYFRKCYLYAPRSIKRKLHEYYFNTINQNLAVDEKYENEVKKIQKSYFKKEIAKLILSGLFVLLVTLTCFWTLTFSSLTSAIFIIVLNGIAYGILFKRIYNILNVGRVPGTIQTDIEKQHYYQQIRKALDPKQAALFLPNYFTKRNKKRVLVIVAICLISTLSFVIKDIIVKVQNNNLTYYYVFNEVVITGGYGDEIVIPEFIDGREVVKIANKAFYGNVNLKSITISEGVEEIGSLAFSNCSNLEYVKVPSTINRVRNTPFTGSNKIKNFVYDGNIITYTKFLGENYKQEMLDITLEEYSETK